MTGPLVADYSFARPDLAALHAAGYVGIVRYLSWTDSKNLTRDEVDQAFKLGMWVALNWEGDGHWELLQGAPNGTTCGERAAELCKMLGAPATTPIFVSADYQATPDQFATIGAFLDAFRAASGHPVGIYGQSSLIDYCITNGHASVAWQTNAASWSNYQISEHAALIQHADPASGPFAGAIDWNELAGSAASFAWTAHTESPTPLAPVSVPLEEPDVPVITVAPGVTATLPIPVAYKKPLIRFSTDFAAKGGCPVRVMVFGPDNLARPTGFGNPKDPDTVWVPNGAAAQGPAPQGSLGVTVTNKGTAPVTLMIDAGQ